MARKTAIVTIVDREVPKRFLLTEMSATEAEDWALELFFAMSNAGVDVPDDIVELGFAGVVGLGIQALGKIPYEKAKPLLKRMFACIQFIPGETDNIVRPLLESDIEDVATRLQLRKEVWMLHTDFLDAVRA